MALEVPLVVLDDLIELDGIVEMVWAALDWMLLVGTELLELVDETGHTQLHMAALDMILLVEGVLDWEAVEAEDTVPNW